MTIQQTGYFPYRRLYRKLPERSADQDFYPIFFHQAPFEAALDKALGLSYLTGTNQTILFMNTALFANLNWLAIIVAAIAYFGLGAIWYSALFGKKWVAYHNINVEDPEMKKGVAATMLSSFFLMFVAVFCLAMLVSRLGLTEALSGVKLGLITGVGIAATAVSIGYLYTKKPFGLYLIDGLYHVGGNVLAAIILCVWQ